MSRNGSVWTQQVELALLNKINSCVRSYSKDGELIPNRIIVLKPDKEIAILEYPCITLFNFNQEFAWDRHEHGKVLTEIDKDSNKGVLEDKAKPYNLSYQVCFWCEFQSDLDQMTRDWLEKIEPFSVLDCIDTEGNLRHCFMEQLKPIANLDNAQDNNSKRLFRRVYSYKICVELDNPNRETVKLISKDGVEIKLGGVKK